MWHSERFLIGKRSTRARGPSKSLQNRATVHARFHDNQFGGVAGAAVFGIANGGS